MNSLNREVWLGDCLELMKNIPDGSIDAVVTDPPYGLSFMGKKWDYDVPSVEIWKECLRVLKPGGYLLAFAGTRTQHRMAVRIEDAGFEIRDMIAWIYGSGFPKSLNIGKAVDKTGGQSLSWFIDYVLKVADEKGISRKELTMLFPSKNGNPTGWLWNKQKTQGVTLEQYHKIKEFLQLPFADITECEREVVGRGKAGLTAGTIANFSGGKEFDLTKGTSEWEGWGTALKPALEPITVARKPLSEKTVALNCLKWGVGGINIDGCRVEAKNGDRFGGGGLNSPVNGFMGNTENTYKKGTGFRDDSANGRFPANLIHDGSDEVVGLFPQSKSTGGRAGHTAAYSGGYKQEFYGDADPGYNDNGSAARFFYCAKASKSERNRGCEELEDKAPAYESHRANYANTHGIETPFAGTGRSGKNFKNNHPTVKPVALMEYLVKLVSREGAVVLDPFAGSGSTGIACQNLNRDFILIEREPQYVEIIKARLAL